MTRSTLCLAAALLFTGAMEPGVASRPDAPVPPVIPNDNRTPAGTLHGDTLELRLEVRMGIWSPEGSKGPSIEVAAFAEPGQEPRIPGPLIRVPAGTTVVATVTNALSDSTIAVHGLATHPAAPADSLVLRPGESRQVRFAAGAPGTYLYRAVLGKHAYNRVVDDEREQVAGAFVVDPSGGSPPDRIFLIAIWGGKVDSARHHRLDYRNAITINGRSWPETERIDAATGDTLRWRVINASGRIHPMHLHGFYYEVESRGDGLVDTLYPPEAHRLVVTEPMRRFSTMALSFVPDRPGNWLFHCHVGFHVVPGSRLGRRTADPHDAMSHDAGVHMAGLVIGIRVHDREERVTAAGAAPVRLRLFVQEGPRRLRAQRAMSFILQRDRREPKPDSVEIPGSTLALTQGRPTEIVVINRLDEPTSIHWHGIELESYSDGVSGWSGSDTRMAPAVMPGDSFIARLTLPRAGTFMYHTHLNDVEQLSSGLYGAIVVLKPGERFDPKRDHVFVSGWDGEAEPPPILVNGDSMPAPLLLAAGVPHRFRFVNIGLAAPVSYSLGRDTIPVQWRRLAKDGADLPERYRTLVPARLMVEVGETYDFEFVPEPGEYRLAATDRDRPIMTRVVRGGR